MNTYSTIAGFLRAAKILAEMHIAYHVACIHLWMSAPYPLEFFFTINDQKISFRQLDEAG